MKIKQKNSFDFLSYLKYNVGFNTGLRVVKSFGL